MAPISCVHESEVDTPFGAILDPMNKVEAIEKDVEALSPGQLAAFRRWFHEFDAVVWDRQLEEDVRAGKLDALADEALQAYKSGKCTEL